MRAVGLITEYNPFHNGHLYHLQQSRLRADADVAVAVMSGNFLQRGEPALCDKWYRTEMALAAGVDLVVELPYIFACNSAPHFARGAVAALEGLGGIDCLCFGSEAGALEPLRASAELLTENEQEVEQATQMLLRQGVAYPAARARILASRFGQSSESAMLTEPNNILGIEYLKALHQAGSVLKPLTLKRQGAGYHDLTGQGSIASATGIRRMLAEDREVADYLPPEVSAILDKARKNAAFPILDLYLRLLLAKILGESESLAEAYQLEPGQENRLMDAARQATSLEELVDAVKARQLTRTRVQRLLCHVLNEVRDELAQALLQQGPLYLHLLGTSARGEQVLAASRKQRSLPLVSNYSRIQNQLQRFYGRESRELALARKQLQLELRCSANYALLQSCLSAARQPDYTEKVRRPGD